MLVSRCRRALLSWHLSRSWLVTGQQLGLPGARASPAGAAPRAANRCSSGRCMPVALPWLVLDPVASGQPRKCEAQHA